MLKNYFSLSLFILITSSFSASFAVADIAEDAEELRKEINALNNELTDRASNEVAGKKKEKILKLFRQLRLKRPLVRKFLNDPNISDQAKSKIIEGLKKVKEEAITKCGGKEELFEEQEEESSSEESFASDQ